MGKNITFFVLMALSNLAYSQQHALTKQWDQRFGGVGDDDLFSFQQTYDSGYILGGSSASDISGDKTQASWGHYDFWVVKTDGYGNQQWDKRFGGNSLDALNHLQQTSDSGFILGGFSGSGISGDITQAGFGGYDYWVVKIDAQGNKQWDKRFGGSGDDLLQSLQQTKDGGYILGGFSNSGISGDKTQADWDSTGLYSDYWVVKIDAQGNKQWDKRFGGVLDDDLYAILQTNDGGYLLGGKSYSGIGGDVTQLNWDTTNSTTDYWIVKIDSVGIKQWDKRFGGTGWDNFSCMTATLEGGYVVAGSGGSDSSGNKSQNVCNGTYDYWMVKIDWLGNKAWDKDYGGSNQDNLESIVQTSDKGYLLSGYSGSAPSCQKTEANLGPVQTWLIKTDSAGNKQWDKTIFTTGFDVDGFAIQTYDGCYAIAKTTQAGIGGYKTQANWDTTNNTNDYWIIKICDTGNPLSIEKITSTLQFTLYPNPFTTDLNVLLQKQDLKQATFTITNPLGQIIYTKQENNLSPSYTKMLDLNYLPNGVYFVEVEVDGQRETKKVVKSGP